MRSKGMSLVEVVIAIAMLSGVVYITAESIGIQQQYSKATDAWYFITRLTQEVMAIVNDDKSCYATLANKNPVAGDNSITSIRRKPPSSAAVNVFVQGQKYFNDNLLVSQIRVSNFIPTKSPTRGIFTLGLDAIYTRGGSVWSYPVTQTIILEGEIDAGNQLTNCYMDRQTFAESLCNSLGGEIINGRCHNLNIVDTLRATGDINTGSLFNANSLQVQNINVTGGDASVSTNMNVSTTTSNTGSINANRIVGHGGVATSVNLVDVNQINANRICINGVCRTFNATSCAHYAIGISSDGNLLCSPLPPPPLPPPPPPPFPT